MSIQDLAMFYKHMMNICHNCRTVNGEKTSPAYGGWMRNRVTPYLTNGRIIDPLDTFLGKLDYTVEDYMEWSQCTGEGAVMKTRKLLKFIRTTPDLINYIESFPELFPTEQDTTHNNMIEEDWNQREIKWNLKQN